jgi:hypothetical protein
MKVNRSTQMQKRIFNIENLLKGLVSEVDLLKEGVEMIETENAFLHKRCVEVESEWILGKEGEIRSRADEWDMDE